MLILSKYNCSATFETTDIPICLLDQHQDYPVIFLLYFSFTFILKKAKCEYFKVRNFK